jgi:hypothetical protein
MGLLLLALAVAAQAPDTAGDRQARYERVLNQAADSLDQVRGAGAGFRTDLASASRDLVLERAARMQASCRGASGALLQVASLLDEGVYERRAAREQSALRAGTGELQRTMARCQRDWGVPAQPTAAQADSLRLWGPYRASQLDIALRRYLGLLRAFMKRAALRKPAVS